MDTLRPDAASGERGFLLVGVVMFMLALTILGLSLFALSSYEAQFFHASAAHEQSLQSSESGMEVVKALLAMDPPRLENAQLAVGQFGITRAMAYQWRSGLPADTVSQGPVNWDSTVVIVVSARRGAAERTLQARFIPTSGANPYQRVITAGLGIHYDTEQTSDPAAFHLQGRVWQHVQTASDTAWTDYVTWSSGRPVEPTATAQPLADAFVDAHLPSASAPSKVEFVDVLRYELEFLNYGTGPKFFMSPLSPTDKDTTEDPQYNDYTFYTHHRLEITIRGTVVWVVPAGACFRHAVTVVTEGGAPSTLVIVAKANGRDPGYESRGIWFKGGLQVTDSNARVYLVSQGDIGLTHGHDVTDGQEARSLSVVAGGDVEIGGPQSGEGERDRLLYQSSTMDALADELLAQGALPRVAGGTGTRFALARKSWLETTPR